MKLILALAAMMIAMPTVSVADEAVTTVTLDYTGNCGPSLPESRTRDKIERDAYKIIYKLKKDGKPYRVMIIDPSVRGNGGYFMRAGDSFPVFNRNYGC